MFPKSDATSQKIYFCEVKNDDIQADVCDDIQADVCEIVFLERQ